MSNFARKIKKNQEIVIGRFIGGRFPKHRCNKCHRMTLYDKEGNCIYCFGKAEKLFKNVGLDIKEDKQII